MKKHHAEAKKHMEMSHKHAEKSAHHSMMAKKAMSMPGMAGEEKKMAKKGDKKGSKYP